MRREDIAYKIQEFMSELSVDNEGDIIGTGPVSFQIADYALSALTNTSGDDEEVKPLLGTRFKLNFNKAGNCTNFYRSQAEELEGQWVWLIDATDGMNNPVYARPQSAAVRDGAPIADPLRRETDETWKQVIGLFRKHGMPEPPVKLRDDLVIALEWAWFGYEGAKR